MADQPKRPIGHISECSVVEVRILAPILSLNPDNPDPLSHFAGTVLNGIKKLPKRLQRPGALMSIIKPYAKSRAPLCDLHHGLHPKIIASLFTLIALEVGYHLNRLANNMHMLTEDQVQLVLRLRQMHLLWHEKETYERTFGRLAEGPWKYEDSQCEACIIHRLASNFEAVCDLRCAVLARMNTRQMKHRGEPLLKVWLDYWLEQLKTYQTDFEYYQAMEKNKADGLALKERLKKIYYDTPRGRKRAEKKLRMAGGTEESASTTAVGSSPYPRPVSGMQEQAEDGNYYDQDVTDAHYDAELEVVDHYAALKSTLDVPMTAASRYSNNTVRNNERVIGQSRASRVPSVAPEKSEQGEYINPRAFWKRDSTAEKNAKSYQNILSSPPATARSAPNTARTGVSEWEDVPISSASTVESPGIKSVARGIFDVLSGDKHRSKRASEWTPVPELDAHARELKSTDPRSSSVVNTPINYYFDVRPTPSRAASTSTRHSQPAGASLSERRGRGKTSSSYLESTRKSSPSVSSRRSSITPSDSASSWSRTDSVTSAASRYSRDSAPSKKSVPENLRHTAATNMTRWSNAYRSNRDSEVKKEKKGKGKEPEVPKRRGSKKH